MIEKEAINVMTQAREDAGQAFLGKVQFNVPQYHAVIKALEKQIPKKPKKHGYGKWYFCPDCLRLIKKRIEESSHDIKFCPFCGQAFDWGDEECGS